MLVHTRPMQPILAILTGGTSSERDVALQSAMFVEEQLHTIFAIRVYDFPKDIERFLHERSTIDLAIPLFHGVGGEDGTIQGFLKTLHIPFLFSDVEAQAIGMNKALTKEILQKQNIPVASSLILFSSDRTPAYQGSCVIKPLDGGSSIGVTIAHTEEQFKKGLEEGFRWSKRLMIEPYIKGREFTVAVIEEAQKLIALPVIEIRSKHAFFDLESKYDPTLVEELCPAPIDEELASQLKRLAIDTHRAIGAKHLSRTDFIVDIEGKPWALEINTIPGQTKNSLLPKAILISGRTLGAIYKGWVEDLLNR